MRKPIIGLIAAEDPRTAPEKHMVNTSYLQALISAGATPLVIPVDGDAGRAGEYIPLLDGLLVPGGEDVTPSLYGQAALPQVRYTAPDKDRMDLALVRMAAEAGLPVFGICRGLQVINVCFGGTLIQDLPSQRPGTLLHTSEKDAPRTHGARLVRGSLMERLLGSDTLTVNTYHHQAVDVLAPGFSITAFAEDGVVEAIEDPARHIYAVQWHPERMVETHPRFRPLFRYLVEQAAVWREAHKRCLPL